MTQYAAPVANALPHPVADVIRLSRRRIHESLAVRWGARCAAACSLIALPTVAIARLVVGWPLPWVATLAAIAGVTGIATIIGFARPLDDRTIARLLDERAMLKNRVASAVETSPAPVGVNAAFVEAQHADTAAHLDGVDVRTLWPVRAHRDTAVAVGALLVIAAIYLLPVIRLMRSPAHRAELAAVRTEGLRIIHLAQPVERKATATHLDESRKAAIAVKKLGEAMRANRVDRKEAMVAMHKLTDQMRATQRRLASTAAAADQQAAKSEMQHALDQLAAEKQPPAAQPAGAQPGTTSPSDQHAEMATAQQQIDALAGALARSDYAAARKAAEALSKQLRHAHLTAQQTAALRKKLKQLKGKMNGRGGKSKDPEYAVQGTSDSADTSASASDDSASAAAESVSDSQAEMDARTLEQLADELGSGAFCRPGERSGTGGRHPGQGYLGKGGPFGSLKDPGATKPHLVGRATTPARQATGHKGDAKKFARLLALGTPHTGPTPNGRVAGVRQRGGNEQQINGTGDPGRASSSEPYYQAYTSGRRQAESALSHEAIPAPYRRQVRTYFNTIHP